jgi:hypothetical protein
MKLKRDLLEIKNHVGGVFYHTFDRRELMLDALDFHCRHGCTLN